MGTINTPAAEIKPTGVTIEVRSITPDEDGRDVEAQVFVDGVADGRVHFETKATGQRLAVGKTYELKERA